MGIEAILALVSLVIPPAFDFAKNSCQKQVGMIYSK